MKETRAAVDEILAALGGRPVLLPLDRGQKGVFFDGWQKLTWDDTQNPQTVLTFSRRIANSRDEAGRERREVYRRATYGELIAASCAAGGNIGVLLGAASSASVPVTGEDFVLCSIDVDSAEGEALLIEANPWLENTLRTRGERGSNFWLWVDRDGREAATRKIFFADASGKEDPARPFGEWRGDGAQTLIWGVHPSGHRYTRVGTATSPVRCNFRQLVWPEALACPWWRKTPWDRLVKAHGVPWLESQKGGLVLNPVFFVAKYAMEHEVLFEPEEGEFYSYAPARGLWSRKSRDAIAWDFAQDFKSVADASGKPGLLCKRSNQFLRGLTQQLAGAVERRNAFEREPGLIHLANCVLDLRCSPPRTHSFRSSFRSRNQVPVPLDEEARCPRFLDDLVRSAVSDADANLLQRVAGSLLLGPNIAQRFALLYGTAGAGKSTWISLMRRMIGEANVTQLRTKHLEERFELYFYVGKTLLIGPDVPGDFMQAPGAHVVKALVGGDPLTAERKQGGEAIQIRGVFNVLLSCNSRLRIRLDGDTEAWRRRMLPILYNRPKPAKPDPLFLDRLFSEEAPGVLMWMINGARQLLREFDEVGGYRLDKVHEDRIDSLLAESDSVRHFVRHGLAVESGETVTLEEIQVAYSAYCDAKGWRPETYKRAGFGLVDAISEIHRLTPRHDIRRHSETGADQAKKTQRGYKGLRVLTPNTAENDDTASPY